MQSEEIKIMERDELISAVIEKHEKLIAEYTAECDALKNKSGALDTEIEDLKKRIEESDEKMKNICDEKKHISGKNALEELEKLSLGQIEEEKIKNGIIELTSDKISDTIDERKVVYDALRADVNNAKGANFDFLLAKIDAAFEDCKEEKRLIEAINADKVLLVQKEGEVREDKKVDWLERRIGSHRESLDYWKGAK